MPLEPQERTALLAFAAAAYERRPLPPIADWETLLTAAWGHGLIPLAYQATKGTDCPERVKEGLRSAAFALAARFEMQQSVHAEALDALAKASIDTIVLKGPALARTIYAKPFLRVSSDLDVLIHEEDWLATHQALLDLDYSPVQSDSAPPPKVWKKKAYYHTQYDRGDTRIEVHYDLWWYGLRPALGESHWSRSVPLEVGGVSSRRVSWEDMLLQLCIHLHHHGYNRLIWFTDIALLIRQNAGLDWDRIVAAARTEGLGVFVYYSLYYVERLLGVGAPPEVLAALRPKALQTYLHDRLCPPDTVRALEVTDRVLFDFHELPDARELLLNLVLTGRRREKLTYLARLLVPPAEWLTRYYGAPAEAITPRRRAVHAPRMLAKAAGELGSLARHGFERHMVA